MPQSKKPRPPADVKQEDARAKLREHYSERTVDHMLRPRNMGPLRHPDGQARTESGHGEAVEFFLQLDGERISDCAFWTDGCAATLACASAATELARDKPLDKVLAVVTAERILTELDGLPEGNVHCAHLVASAFREAAADARSQRADPWKKLYRKT
jgi:NifU-like protein involved in Fe-S cluster formation